MRHFWKQLAYAAIAKLIVADRERIVGLLRARVTKNQPVLTMDMSDLEALILAQTHEKESRSE